MGLKATADLRKLDALIGKAARDRAQRAFAEKVLADTERFVPKDTGALRNSVDVLPDGETILYPMEYAGHVYSMDGEVRWTEPGTGARWDEESAEANMGEWERYAADVLMGGGR